MHEQASDPDDRTQPVAMTTRRVFAIAGPAMLANLTTPLLGIVATAAVGRLGDTTLLGGVAMASVAFDCLFWLFGFLRMGTVALTAQALGAGDEGERRAVLARAVALALALGIALVAIQQPLGAITFAVIGGSDAATAAARSYFAVRLWSAPLVLGNYVLLGWLVGQARPGLALLLQIVVNSVNIGTTVVLVLGLNTGIVGAAAAAVIAESTGFILGGALAWRLLGGRLAVGRAALLRREEWRRLIAMNRDILIRTAALIAAFLFFTAQGARAGDEILAANAVLNNFMLVGAFFLDGLATAAEQLCGQTTGARDGRGFRRAARLVVSWGVAFGGAVTLVFLLAGAILIDIITTSETVRATARLYLTLAALAPLSGALAYTFDGIFIGATWSRDMRNLMILSLGIYFVAWWLMQPLGNNGLWLALLIFLLARGLSQALRYPVLVRRAFNRALLQPSARPVFRSDGGSIGTDDLV